MHALIQNDQIIQVGTKPHRQGNSGPLIADFYGN